MNERYTAEEYEAVAKSFMEEGEHELALEATEKAYKLREAAKASRFDVMKTVVGLLFCLLLGIYWKKEGILSLFWLPLGLAFGLFAAAQIVLPIIMGIPRALRLISQGYMRKGVFVRLLVGPAVFLFLLLGIEVIVGFFFPSIADFVRDNGALNAGGWLGILAIVTSPLSHSARSDFRDDFDRAYSAYYIVPPDIVVMSDQSG